MTTTQRPRQQPSGPAPDPATRGLILVAVAVVIGIILLVKGGGIGVDRTATDLEIEAGGDTTETTTTTTEPEAPATSVPAAALKVVALNGAGINGYAGRAQQVLSVAGYSATTVGTASERTDATIVYFAPGYEADAAAVAAVFGVPAESVQPMPEGDSLASNSSELPADTNVIVWLGPDVQGRIDSAIAGEPEDSEAAEGSESTDAG